MKNYIKYMVLLVILILVGVVGIYLYSNQNLKPKENLISQSNLKEEKEKENTSNESDSKEEDKSEEKEEENTSKDNTSSNSVSANNGIETSKGTISQESSSNNSKIVENKEGEVSTNANPTDLTVGNSNSSTTNSNSSTAEEFHVLDITKEGRSSVSTITEKNTDQVSSSVSNASISNSSSNVSDSNDTIVLEVDNSVYDEEISEQVNNSVSVQSTISTNSSNTSGKTDSSQSISSSISTTTSANSSSSSSSTTTNSTTSSTTTETSKNNTTNNTSSSKSTSNASEKGFDTNVSFSNIDNCINNKVIKTVKGSNGKTSKIHTCISKYNLNNKNSMMQNFAITDNFVYFSYDARGLWVKTETSYNSLGKRGALEKVSANYVVRINRKTNKYQRIYVEYAGHTQSFDVTNVSGNEQIYMNYFARLYKGSLGYGSQYVGVTAVNFKDNTSTSGFEVIPTSAISVSSDGKKFNTLKSSSYYVDGVFNSSKYYDKVVSIGSSSNKMINPEVAVDEEHNRIVLTSKKVAYVYDLEDFKNGKATLLKKFSIASGKQGVELYNGYLYLWTGNRTHTLYKYKVSTGKLVNRITFNLSNYYGSGGGNEAEGISIYKGNVYIGIPGSKCNGKICNDIFLVEGF